MAKTAKKLKPSSSSRPRDARTGAFVVAKQAVASKRFKPSQIREAVRKVIEAEAAKGK